jgi:hypothetical protein
MASGIKPRSVIAKTKHEADKKTLGLSSKGKRPSLQECVVSSRYANRSVHYFTTGTGVDQNTMRDVSKEPTPFWFPSDTEQFSYRAWYRARKERLREEQSRCDFSTRPNYRTRQNMDIRNRLFIPDEETDEFREPGLLDIDPHYFKILEGRPIREKLDIRKYIEEGRETLKTRLKVGYQLDEVMRIEEEIKEKQERLSCVQDLHKVHADNFDKFLEEDYNSSMKLLHEAQQQAEKSTKMSHELNNLEKKLGALKCQVYILEEKWRHRKMFQKFLYMVSPMHWRKENDYIHRKGPDSVLLVSEMSTLFGRYKLPSTEPDISLDASLDLFLKEINTEEEPLLYFTKPVELTQVFQEVEVQNLNLMLHSQEVSESAHTANLILEQTRRQFQTESAFIRRKIENLKTAITAEENRVQSLRDKARDLLYGLYNDVVLSESVLNLHVFVEDVYETCIAPNDSNLGLRDMMHGIELKMESLLLDLDYLPSEVVDLAETQTYEEEARVIKEAKEAQVKVNLLEKLKYRLKRVLEPPPYRKGRQLKTRSEPPPIEEKQPKEEAPISDKEMEFLIFFTDYSVHVNTVCHYYPLKLD